MNRKLIFPEESYAIQGALFEVANTMGTGFLEEVYQECVEKELSFRGIPYESQKQLSLTYKGEPLHKTYRADVVCYGKIILELKAVKRILPEHEAQVINYLKATGFPLALLVNFCSVPTLYVKRFVNDALTTNLTNERE